MGSENPTAGGDDATPGNQQERLENIGWVIGFVDGEGCFSAPVVKSPKMTIGWQVQPAFAVVQGEAFTVLENPQRPYANPLLTQEKKRWSGPCGDVGRSAEMTDPPNEK